MYKDINGFWKAWRKKFCSKGLKPTSRLNNSVGDLNILEEFSNHFSKLGQTNTAGSDDNYRNFVSEYLHTNSSPDQPVHIPVIDLHTSPAELWWNLALEYKVFFNADY